MLPVLALALLAHAAEPDPAAWSLLGANLETGAIAYATYVNTTAVTASALSAPPCAYLGLEQHPYETVTLHLAVPGPVPEHLSWTVVEGQLAEDRCTTTSDATLAVDAARAAYAEHGVRFDQRTTPDGWLRDGALAWTPMLNPTREAFNRLNRANELIDAGDFDAARALLIDLRDNFQATDAASRASRLLDEIALLGQPAPALEALSWFTHPPKAKDPAATLVVFWEVWCPHCQRELPKLEGLSKRLGPNGLEIVAVTRMTRGMSAETVNDFIRSNRLTYAIGREDGHLAEAFQVAGIPAAAVVKDGVIVWRGHPSDLDDAKLKRWLTP